MTRQAGGLVDIGDFSYDDTTIDMVGGVADEDTHVWRRPGVAGIEMAFRIGTAVHNTVVGTVPDDYLPRWTVYVVLASNSVSPGIAFASISATGTITYHMYNAGSELTYVRGSAAWPLFDQ